MSITNHALRRAAERNIPLERIKMAYSRGRKGSSNLCAYELVYRNIVLVVGLKEGEVITVYHRRQF